MDKVVPFVHELRLLRQIVDELDFPTDPERFTEVRREITKLDPGVCGAPSGRSRRLPSTSRPPGTAYSRRLVLHGREEALSTPGGSRGMPRRGIAELIIDALHRARREIELLVVKQAERTL